MTTEPRRETSDDRAAAGASARHMLVLAYLGAVGTLLAGIGTLLAVLMD